MLDMIKRYFLLVLTVFLLVLCVGCGEDSANADTEGTALHLTCWIEDMELDRLIEMFEETHPGVTIEVKAYYDDAEDFSTATSRMNAELATGGDVDLYYLENAIDVMALVNAGLLADLYPLMESDESFATDEYYENIWESMELYGSLYEISAGFQIGAIVGAQTLLGDRTGWTIEEYQAFEAQQPDPETLLPQTRSSMLNWMMAYAMFDYIDVGAGTCSFDSDSFTKWLEFVASFPVNVDNTIAAEAQTRGSWFSGLYEYIQRRDEFGDALQFVGFPSDGAYSPCIETLLSFGISSQTEQTGLCWEFIKMMLSQEYQEQVIAYSSFPMRKSVFEDQLSASMLPSTEEGALVSSDSILGPLTQEESDKLRELVSSLSVIRFRYADVTNIIEEEASSFFNGAKTADDVAKIIQNRVGIYLSEHSR